MSEKKRHGSAETALIRHETYREGMLRSIKANMLMGAATLAAVAMSFYAMTDVTEPRYFLASEDGRIVELQPVSQPYLNNGQITNFAVEAITDALTMNFVTYRQDLAEASEYFERPAGWNNFLEALKGSGTLEFIQNRRLISSVVANGASIVRSGVEGGRYTWVVQVPITITYQSSSEQSTDSRLAELQIVRLPNWETPRGVGISRVLIK